MLTSEVDPAFGHWLAGFVDGEGCFAISKAGGGYFVPEFKVSVRDDDCEIIERIKSTLDIGHIDRDDKACDVRRGINVMPQIRWRCRARADAEKLVELFTRFPLQSKKARDFNIWSRAITETTSNAELAPYYQELRDIRAYKKISPSSQKGRIAA